MWTPMNMANDLAVWLKADAITGLSNGATLTTWPDSGMLGYDAAQTTANDKPIYSTADTFSTVEFDADNTEYLTCGHVTELEVGTGDFFWAVVCRFIVLIDGAKQTVLQKQEAESGGSTGHGIRFMNERNTSSQANKRVFYGGAGATTLLVDTPGEDVLDDDYHIWVSNRTGGTLYGSKDSGTVASMSAALNINDQKVTPDRDLKVGGGAASGLSSPMEGRVAELVIAPGTLSSRDKDRIEGYLAHKYSLTGSLPSGHAYKTDFPAAPLGINYVAGENNLAAKSMGELVGDPAWKVDEVQPIQRS